MAKIPMITRTLKTTVVNVLCMDIARGERFNLEVVLSRTYKDNIAILKAVAAVIDCDEVKPVHVVNSYVEEILYAMKETDFIANAEVLPTRGCKDATESE